MRFFPSEQVFPPPSDCCGRTWFEQLFPLTLLLWIYPGEVPGIFPLMEVPETSFGRTSEELRLLPPFSGVAFLPGKHWYSSGSLRPVSRFLSWSSTAIFGLSSLELSPCFFTNVRWFVFTRVMGFFLFGVSLAPGGVPGLIPFRSNRQPAVLDFFRKRLFLVSSNKSLVLKFGVPILGPATLDFLGDILNFLVLEVCLERLSSF